MASPVPNRFGGRSHPGRRMAALIAFGVLVLCSAGCSINLGSLSGSGEKDDAAQGASGSIASVTETIGATPTDAQAYNARGLLLAQGGKSEEALADLNKAISLDPNYGHAYAIARRSIGIPKGSIRHWRTTTARLRSMPVMRPPFSAAA